MKFSIVTPSFNQAAFLERTLRSVLTQQGLFELELLVEDGGSSDGSVDLLRETESAIRAGTYPGLHPQATFSWISEKDRGQSHAINKGLAKSSGDVLAYLNSDDVYLPGALAAVANHFETHPATLWCYGGLKIIDEQDRETRGAVSAYREALGRSYSLAKLLVVNFVPQPATFWRRACFEQVGGFEEGEHLVMDYEYWCRLAQLGPAGVVQEKLAGFRTHPSSKSVVRNRQMFADGYRVACHFTESKVLRLAHWVHDQLVCSIYRWL